MKYLPLILLLPVMSYKSPSYMRTGFYYLAEPSHGVRMQKAHSNEIYSVARSPFASVDHISRTELSRQNCDGTKTVALCMIFDPEGTKDIQRGTGNPLHPKIAVIIANKLLYVVDNSTRIEKGVMCILVDEYSEQEIAAMQKAIEEKK